MTLRSPIRFGTLALVVVLALVAGSACSTRYPIRMRGVFPDAEVGIAAASRVAVEKVPEINEDDHDAVIVQKLTHLLETSGFEVVPLEEATYVLLYNAESHPVSARQSFGAASSGKGGMKITTNPGPLERSVRLHMLDAAPFREDGTEEVIWSCHTVMPKVPNSSPRFEDLLLAGTFTHFCEDTQAVLTWKIAFNDENARALHAIDPMAGE